MTAALPQMVVIEWEDSTQPTPNWQWLSALGERRAIICQTVGWLLSGYDDPKVVALSLSCLDEEGDRQVSGVIQIPARAIISLAFLAMPAAASGASGE